MDTVKTLVATTAICAIVVGAYYAMSCYEQCVSDQKAQIRAEHRNVDSGATGGLGGKPNQLVKFMCSKMINWQTQPKVSTQKGECRMRIISKISAVAACCLAMSASAESIA